MFMLIIGTDCIADELQKKHEFSFGKVYHTLPSEVFKHVRTIARTITPAITQEYRFEETGDASAVLVITKIRQDYPKDDSLLDRTISKSKNLQKHVGKKIVLLRTVSKRKPRIEELVFLNAGYGQSFPYGLGGSGISEDVQSIGISLTFVQNGFYIECAMHLKRKESESRKSFIKRTRKLCAKWQRTIKAKKKI